QRDEPVSELTTARSASHTAAASRSWCTNAQDDVRLVRSALIHSDQAPLLMTCVFSARYSSFVIAPRSRSAASRSSASTRLLGTDAALLPSGSPTVVSIAGGGGGGAPPARARAWACCSRESS